MKNVIVIEYYYYSCIIINVCSFVPMAVWYNITLVYEVVLYCIELVIFDYLTHFVLKKYDIYKILYVCTV